MEKNVLGFLTREKINFIPNWPSYSPQLSTIENVWPHLNALVTELRPTNEEELERAVLSAWSSIPQTTIDNCVKSFRAKLEACIKSKGAL